MKRRHFSLLVATAASFLAALSGVAAPDKPVPSKTPGRPPLSPRFIQVRDRIQTLFQHRNETPPPDLRTNPFRPAGSAAVAARPDAAPQISSDDLALLQQAVMTLKVTGTMEKDDQSYVMVNNRPYKKNDVIQARSEGGESVYLRVHEITRHTVTLSLNDTEITLKF